MSERQKRIFKNKFNYIVPGLREKTKLVRSGGKWKIQRLKFKSSSSPFTSSYAYDESLT